MLGGISRRDVSYLGRRKKPPRLKSRLIPLKNLDAILVPVHKSQRPPLPQLNSPRIRRRWSPSRRPWPVSGHIPGAEGVHRIDGPSPAMPVPRPPSQSISPGARGYCQCQSRFLGPHSGQFWHLGIKLLPHTGGPLDPAVAGDFEQSGKGRDALRVVLVAGRKVLLGHGVDPAVKRHQVMVNLISSLAVLTEIIQFVEMSKEMKDKVAAYQPLLQLPGSK